MATSDVPGVISWDKWKQTVHCESERRVIFDIERVNATAISRPSIPSFSWEGQIYHLQSFKKQTIAWIQPLSNLLNPAAVQAGALAIPKNRSGMYPISFNPFSTPASERMIVLFKVPLPAKIAPIVASVCAFEIPS